MADEAIDFCGRQILSGLAGSLEDSIRPPFIDAVELTEVNHKSIIQLVNSVNVKLNTSGNFSNLKLLITHGASYMIKAGGILEEPFEDLTHITCVAHALHRLSIGNYLTKASYVR